jgi:hypothetical protein
MSYVLQVLLLQLYILFSTTLRPLPARLVIQAGVTLSVLCGKKTAKTTMQS